MKLQNISRSSQAFGIKMVNYLQAIHNASIRNGYDKEKSDYEIQKLDKILPDYTLTTGYINGQSSLSLERYNKETGLYHTIQLYSADEAQTKTLEDINVNNLGKLIDGLKSIYGEEFSIEGKKIKITSPIILENKKAQEVIQGIRKNVMPRVEEYFSLKEPYLIEISTAGSKGKNLYLTSRTDDRDEFFEPVVVKENIEITIKTYDKAHNPVSYKGYFYLPEDLNERDNADFWVDNFKKTLIDILKNRYHEVHYNQFR